jgi:virginiamycin B lyase
MLLAAGGCAGESPRLQTVPTAGAGGTPTLDASVRFLVPNRIGNESARGRRLNRRSRGKLHQLFLAANTAGIKLFVYRAGTRTGAIAQLVGDVSSSSPQCTHVANGRACTFSLAVPAGGPYDFVVSTFDQAPVGGSIPGGANQLGAAVDTTKIEVGKANAVSISVGGVVASTFVIVPRPGLFHAIASTTQQITIGALDRDGNLIASDAYVDPDGDPLTIAPTSNAGSAISFTPASFAAPQTNGVLLKYDATRATSTQIQNGIAAVLSAPSNGIVPGVAQIQIQPYILTTTATGSGPEDVALNGGWQYVTEVTGNQVQAFGNATVNVVHASGNPNGIAAGPGGSVWIAWSGASGLEELQQVGTTVDVGSFISLPGFGPIRIAPGPDGAMWFSEFTANAIGRISPAGTITSYPLPTANAGPQGITAGPDGAVWFTECVSGKIGRIPVNATPGSSAQITEYSSFSPGAAPFSIVAGADGALWFTETERAGIGRITTTGSVTEIAAPSNTSEIASGPDGALWFTQEGASEIGRILVTATPANPGIVEFPTAVANAKPVGIAVDADGSLYYTESALNDLIHMR